MKSVVLFVSALIAVTIADDKNVRLDVLAQRFDIDVPVVQICLDAAELSPEEVFNTYMKIGEIKEITEEVKQSFVKYNKFLSCALEKNGMMVDTKLVVDKILKLLEKDGENFPKEIVTKCINSLNEDSQMTKEDRVSGVMFCVMSNKEKK